MRVRLGAREPAETEVKGEQKAGYARRGRRTSNV